MENSGHVQMDDKSKEKHEHCQQLCDAVLSIWAKISEECFQHPVESVLQGIKTLLKEKNKQSVHQGVNKVYLKKLTSEFLLWGHFFIIS